MNRLKSGLASIPPGSNVDPSGPQLAMQNAEQAYQNTFPDPYQAAQAMQPPTPAKQMVVGPNSGVWNPNTNQWEYKPQPAPSKDKSPPSVGAEREAAAYAMYGGSFHSLTQNQQRDVNKAVNEQKKGSSQNNPWGAGTTGKAFEAWQKKHHISDDKVAEHILQTPKVIRGEDGSMYEFTPGLPPIPQGNEMPPGRQLAQPTPSFAPQGQPQPVQPAVTAQPPATAQQTIMPQQSAAPVQTQPSEQEGARGSMNPNTGSTVKPIISSDIKKKYSTAENLISNIASQLADAKKSGENIAGLEGHLKQKYGGYARQFGFPISTRSKTLHRTLLKLQGVVGPMLLNEKKLAVSERQRLVDMIGDLSTGENDAEAIAKSMSELLDYMEWAQQ